MSEAPEAFVPACGLAIDAGLISLTPVLGHRARNGVVQASVQRPKSSVLIGAFSSTASSVMA
jgi:hypothetical protein